MERAKRVRGGRVEAGKQECLHRCQKDEGNIKQTRDPGKCICGKDWDEEKMDRKKGWGENWRYWRSGGRVRGGSWVNYKIIRQWLPIDLPKQSLHLSSNSQSH